jgi:hypothetical protein
MSTLQQNWRKGQNRIWLEAREDWGDKGEGEGRGKNGPMYAHMNK